MLLFAALTLVLTVVTVWSGRIWPKNSEILILAVGDDANSPVVRFVTKLAIVLKSKASHDEPHATREPEAACRPPRHVVMVKSAQSA